MKTVAFEAKGDRGAHYSEIAGVTRRCTASLDWESKYGIKFGEKYGPSHNQSQNSCDPWELNLIQLVLTKYGHPKNNLKFLCTYHRSAN